MGGNKGLTLFLFFSKILFKKSRFFKAKFLVPKKSLAFVPFWSFSENEKRAERSDAGGVRVHVLVVDLTLRYKEVWLRGCTTSSED